jgi:hypothetical protein
VTGGREFRGRSGPALSEFNDPTAETVASSPKRHSGANGSWPLLLVLT